MTYAIIRFGGKQFKVSEGDKFHSPRLEDPKNEVLLFDDGENIEIGTPILEGHEVKLEKIEDGRDRKIRVGRYKSKSRYRKIKGHKQPFSVFRVTKIGKKGAKVEKTAEVKAEKVEKAEINKEVKTKAKPKVKIAIKPKAKPAAKPTVKPAVRKRGRPAKKEEKK